MFIAPATKRLFSEDLFVKSDNIQENAASKNLLDIMGQFSSVVETGLSCVRGIEKSIKHASTVAWQFHAAPKADGRQTQSAPQKTYYYKQ